MSVPFQTEYNKGIKMASVRRSGLFNKKWYLQTYPDVARAGVNPLKHYLNRGWTEGRNPSPKFDGNAYLRANPDVVAAKMCPLSHYVYHGRAEGRTYTSVDGKSVVGPKPHIGIFRRIIMHPQNVYNEYHKLKDELRALK